jgi:hypothetical protein
VGLNDDNPKVTISIMPADQAYYSSSLSQSTLQSCSGTSILTVYKNNTPIPIVASQGDALADGSNC